MSIQRARTIEDAPVLHPTGMRVREAQAGDQAGIIDLVRRILPEFDLAYDATTSESDLEDIAATYTGGSFQVVLDHDDRVIGTCGLLRLDDRTGKLRKMYLDPAHRGTGLGALLLQRAITFARKAGMEVIRLETVHNMVAAQKLYESHGFRRVQGRTLSPRCDVVMELHLDSE